MFHRRHLEALVKRFTDDCVFRFAEPPEQRGREALRKFFTARRSRQKNYRLKKTLMALDRNVPTHTWARGSLEVSRFAAPQGMRPA